MKYRYLTCCVGMPMKDVPSLNEMIDNSREVTLKTFRKHCDSREWEDSMGYLRRGGLPLSGDWHVRFYKSKFKGKPCYYVVHSAIDYIFT